MAGRRRRTVRERLRSGLASHVKKGVGMSNTLLARFCTMTCGDDFSGVFSADRIPPRLAARNNFLVVVNLARSGEVEGHFVTVAANQSEVLYLDPYAMPCYVGEVVEFLARCGRPVRALPHQIQDFNSVRCAMYALLFCLYLHLDRPFKLRFNTVRLVENDKKCKDYLRRLFSMR